MRTLQDFKDLSFLDQLTDLFELGGIGRFAPLEQNGLRGGNDRTGSGHPVEADLPVELAAATDGIRGDEHLKARSEQIERRLQDTHMSLDARDDDLPMFTRRWTAPVEHLSTTEAKLVRAVAKEFGQFGSRATEALRVLLGGKHRGAEDPGRFNQCDTVLRHLWRRGDERQQFLLHVDDEQPAVLARHQIDTTHIRRG